jgi:hypothetical protein
MSTLYKKERAYIETIYQKVKNKFRELWVNMIWSDISWSNYWETGKFDNAYSNVVLLIANTLSELNLDEKQFESVLNLFVTKVKWAEKPWDTVSIWKSTRQDEAIKAILSMISDGEGKKSINIQWHDWEIGIHYLRLSIINSSTVIKDKLSKLWIIPNVKLILDFLEKNPNASNFEIEPKHSNTWSIIVIKYKSRREDKVDIIDPKPVIGKWNQLQDVLVWYGEKAQTRAGEWYNKITDTRTEIPKK